MEFEAFVPRYEKLEPELDSKELEESFPAGINQQESRMSITFRIAFRSAVAAWGAFLCCVPALAQSEIVPPKAKTSLRIATYNVSMYRKELGGLAKDLSGKVEGSQPAAVAAVIRAVKPDILLLNEVDYDPDANNAAVFEKRFLSFESKDLLGGEPWSYKYVYDGPVNTGVPSGMDLNQNDRTTDPEDAYGYGVFPGQYGMAVLSRFPIDNQNVISFQNMPWASMPNALRPKAPEQPYYYDDATWKKLRLSSKSFWDVPIQTPVGTIHVLASHPTPPGFDGPEDRNGCRNHDEIRMVIDYIDGKEYLVADSGTRGGLGEQDAFVVLGDLNSDPSDGGSRPEAIQKLLKHPRVQGKPIPASQGGTAASIRQGGANEKHSGDPKFDTGDFSDRSVGNLRIDYALPSKDFQIVQAGVFWPTYEEVEPQKREALKACLRGSDHHMVWIDISLAE